MAFILDFASNNILVALKLGYIGYLIILVALSKIIKGRLLKLKGRKIPQFLIATQKGFKIALIALSNYLAI